MLIIPQFTNQTTFFDIYDYLVLLTKDIIKY